MNGRSEDLEGLEFGNEAPAVEVMVFRNGELVHRELCESEEAAAAVVEEWDELEGVECVVDDLSVKHRPEQVLEPESEFFAEEDYPHASGPEDREEWGEEA